MDDKPPLTTVVDARVVIQFTHYTSKTSRYRVLYDGQTLIESTDDPEYDGCRALLAKGITGTFVTFSPGSSTPRARVNIERGAKLMILETERHGPKLVPYKPRPDFLVERAAAGFFDASGGGAPVRSRPAWARCNETRTPTDRRAAHDRR